MLVTVLFIAFAAALLAVRRADYDGRHIALLSAVIWGCYLSISADILSLMALVTRSGLAVAWILFILVALLCALKTGAAEKVLTARQPFARSEWLLTLGLGLVFGIVCITGLLSPPNTQDAMEYHMPRVVMWASNQSLQLFSTPNYAQVVYAPWAETAMLHLYLLWGNDRLVNLVEVFSLIGLSLGASAIARQLGGSRFAQLCAAVIAGTIPSALLEASGAMNTAAGAFWVLTAVYFMICASKEQSASNLFGLSGAIGLAVLTKGTAYVYLPPLLFAAWWPNSYAARMKLLRLAPVPALAVLLINAAQFYRCYELTGSPLGFPFSDAGPGLQWMANPASLGGGVANIFRQLSLHLPTPFPYGYHIVWLNDLTQQSVAWLLSLFGQETNDPSYIWPRHEFKINYLSSNEVFAGNPLHLFLSLTAIGLLFKSGVERRVRVLAIGILLSFASFSFLLRWQEWGGRHHLAVFALMAPVIAIVLDVVVSKRALLVVAAILLLVAMPYALTNSHRSVLPGKANFFSHTRDELYFADSRREMIAGDAIAAAAKVRAANCGQAAIDSFVDIADREILKSPPAFFVYPLMAMSQEQAGAKTFEYIDVHNETSRFARARRTEPCVVICLDCARAPRKLGQYGSYEPNVFGENIIFIKRRSQ